MSADSDIGKQINDIISVLQGQGISVTAARIVDRQTNNPESAEEVTRSDFAKIHKLTFSKSIDKRIKVFYNTILKPAFDRYHIPSTGPKFHDDHYCITADQSKINISIDVNDFIVLCCDNVMFTLPEKEPVSIRGMFCLIRNFSKYFEKYSLINIAATVSEISENVNSMLENLT